MQSLTGPVRVLGLHMQVSAFLAHIAQKPHMVRRRKGSTCQCQNTSMARPRTDIVAARQPSLRAHPGLPISMKHDSRQHHMLSSREDHSPMRPQVMYDVGLILTTGGAVDYTFTPGNATTFATTNTNIVTLTGNTATVGSALSNRGAAGSLMPRRKQPSCPACPFMPCATQITSTLTCSKRHDTSFKSTHAGAGACQSGGCALCLLPLGPRVRRSLNSRPDVPSSHP